MGVKALLCFTSPSSVAVAGVFVYICPTETFQHQLYIYNQHNSQTIIINSLTANSIYD